MFQISNGTNGLVQMKFGNSNYPKVKGITLATYFPRLGETDDFDLQILKLMQN